MKFLDKLGLAIFSIIVLIFSIIICLILFGFIDISIFAVAINSILGIQNGIYITFGILIILILLAIKCLFFPSWEKYGSSSEDEGILLQNDNGKLLITKGTIKNLVNTTVKEFNNIENSDTSIEIDDNNNVCVNLIINVYKETIIKDVSAKLQNRIKEAVKKATDLEIKEINIKVNNVDETEEEKVKGKEKNNTTTEV